MTAAGTWNLSVKTPRGPMDLALELVETGTVLTGTATMSLGTDEISEGAINGNDVSWKLDLTKPFKMSLKFSGTIEGDSMAGKFKMGMFPGGSFEGTRAVS